MYINIRHLLVPSVQRVQQKLVLRFVNGNYHLDNAIQKFSKAQAIIQGIMPSSPNIVRGRGSLNKKISNSRLLDMR